MCLRFGKVDPRSGRDGANITYALHILVWNWYLIFLMEKGQRKKNLSSWILMIFTNLLSMWYFLYPKFAFNMSVLWLN